MASSSSKPTINVCLIGQKFMGRTHSNAFLKVGKFFPTCRSCRSCTRSSGGTRRSSKEFKERWGWQNASTDWKKAVDEPGRSAWSTSARRTTCTRRCRSRRWKPASTSRARSRWPARSPTPGRCATPRRRPKGKTFVWYNYRRVPAVALAHQFAKDGQARAHLPRPRRTTSRTGAGRTCRCSGGSRRRYAGSGAHGDLNAHIIDMARFITGDEITEVIGSIAETFIKEREIVEQRPQGRHRRRAPRRRGKKGKSDVDDAVLFLARFAKGAVASFEATRLATGNQNKNGIEINGEKGSIRFNFEDMNYLEFYDATARAQAAGLDEDHGHPRRRPPVRRQLVAGRAHHRLRARLHQPGRRHDEHASAASRRSCRCRTSRTRTRPSRCWRPPSSAPSSGGR